MNINTELIKNKKFNGAISNAIVKDSQEYRVLAILRYLFPGEYDQMEQSDKPDLQDNINHIGIEVTAAVQENDMKANRIFAEIDKKSCEKQIKDLAKINECGYEFTNVNRIRSIDKVGTSDSEKICFKKAILKKIKKAREYKSNYTRIGLAVLFPEIPTSYAEEHIVDWIKEIKNEIDQSFDFIYVISHRFCIMYDIKSDCTDKKNIKDKEWISLCKIARMTAEGELPFDSNEWK